MIDDAAARRDALDPAFSFAVRAPAGSGKTTLLTQRVLRLLTIVDEPEQIVAITFTRKAAEEMRTRIVEALQLATGAPPDDAFLRQTWELARAARERDQQCGWQLAAQPARLRIMTIDALSQSVVRQMPLTAQMPGNPVIEEDPRQLYREAARDALSAIAGGGSHGRTIAHVLQHVDNDWGKLESLIAQMLARRDQWLLVIGTGSDREVVEQSYARVVAAELEALSASVPRAPGAELVALGAWVGAHLEHSPLDAVTALPPCDLSGLAQWQAYAAMFLTGAGAWRKRVNKNDGFPAQGGDAGAMKQRWQAALDALSGAPELRVRLERVRALPPQACDDAAWTTVSALLTLLTTAAAHLMVHSESNGRSDFTAFSMAALTALGELEAPSDLALSLDYQIRHLLIDEFQDTSHTQYKLVERLTAGWIEGDGRTLFLVGDPMQSIYRFRQADVSLFRDVLERGWIGSVALRALTLSVNFRAQSALVEWINHAMPLALGVIEASDEHFVRQVAHQSAAPEPCVLHAFDAFDGAAEARSVCAIVAGIAAAEPGASVAILVRSRTHLAYITSALIEAGVEVAAREIKPFSELAVISDLLALSRALLHDADRVAWFAVLRAPWCGLTLDTLTRLAARAETLREAVTTATAHDGFASGEFARMERVARIFSRARTASRSAPFSVVLEQTWVELGGPALGDDAQALVDARAFFDVISALESESVSLSAERINNRLFERFSSAAVQANNAVQIMTVHRAKGLEFDHVIIPGLGRRPRAESKHLLVWREQADRDGLTNLLLAPIPIRGDTALYDYLRARDAREASEETTRLLYVALTRARRRVHLLAHARRDQNGDWQPEKGALLNLLWPVLQADFVPADTPPRAASTTRSAAPRLRRARLDSLPVIAAAALGSAPDPLAEPEFDWAGLTARHVGTVIHRLLQDLGTRHGAVPDAQWLEQALRFGRGQLRALGVAGPALNDALDSLRRALEISLDSARARWLFDAAHHEARSELCLAGVERGAAARVIIDRTFIDDEGRRWIIDFKTGTHAGGGREAWLDSEVQRYRGQLERYAAVMAALEQRPIMLGLYFPMLDAWREWTYVGPH